MSSSFPKPLTEKEEKCYVKLLEDGNSEAKNQPGLQHMQLNALKMRS